MEELYEGDGGEMHQVEPDPFKLFPVEMWEEILGKYGDSRHIQNVLTAYPMMEDLVLKFKGHWMMDQVIPHIRPWLENADLLSCRQVCRRWSKAVDNFLENHPTRRAFNREEQIVGQVWVPEASPEFWYRCMGWDDNESPLEVGRRFRDFYPKMGLHPPGRNPFVGRYIGNILRFDYRVRESHEEEQDGNESWNRTVEVLRKFGSEIWYLWTIAMHPPNLQSYERLLTNLNLLPNLKSLILDIYNRSYLPTYIKEWQEPAELVEYLESRRDLLPPLPHLETLRIRYHMSLSPTLADILIRRYSTQIRKLQIHVASRSWRREYCNLFPKLTELSLAHLTSQEEVTYLLLSLEAPDLYSLKLDFQVPYHFGNMVSLISRFKRLQNFRLRFGRIRETAQQEGNEVTLTVPVENVPSLKSLIITGWAPATMDLDLDLLQFFPSLEYLIFDLYHGGPECLKGVPIHKLGLWETLPKLRVLTFTFYYPPDFRRERHRCTRAKYEWLKKKEEKGLSADEVEVEGQNGTESATGDGDGDQSGK